MVTPEGLFVPREVIIRYYGISPSTFNRWIKQDEIPTYVCHDGKIIGETGTITFKRNTGQQVCVNWEDIQVASARQTHRWNQPAQ